MSTITAGEVMTREVTTITQGLSIEDLVKLIKDRNYSGIPVVDADGRAVGLVSQNDVLRALAYVLAREELPQGFHASKRRASAELLELALTTGVGVAIGTFLKRSVKQVMTPELVSCTVDTPLGEVCQLMDRKRVHRIIVVDDDGRVAGLISAIDLVRSYGESLG